MTNTNLPQLARDIWLAGVEAVRPSGLMQNFISVNSPTEITISGQKITAGTGRLALLGFGKASQHMALEFHRRLPEAFHPGIVGHINIVEGTAVDELPSSVTQWEARGEKNLPEPRGVEGTDKLIELAQSLGEQDTAIVFVSGGGSALLPKPVDGVTLEEKLDVIKLIQNNGGTIEECNIVRQQLSAVKGGKLARLIKAGKVFVAILSDVIDDPIDLIASGATATCNHCPIDAIRIIERFTRKAGGDVDVTNVLSFLRKAPNPERIPDTVRNVLIGSNKIACEAAGVKATELGFEVDNKGSNKRGNALNVGTEVAELIRQAKKSSTDTCIIIGGEPEVELAANRPAWHKGGRNQSVVLKALQELWDEGLEGITILSGGTDGEDAISGCAGAFAGAEILDKAKELGLRPEEFLAVNNENRFFEQAGGRLVLDGPTETNVYDVIIVLVKA